MLRSGDRSGSSKKRQRRHWLTILDHMRRTLLRCLALSLTLFLVAAAAQIVSAQQRLLTLDDIYGVSGRVNFSGAPVPAYTWIDDQRYAWPRAAADRGLVDWMSVNARSEEHTSELQSRFGLRYP